MPNIPKSLLASGQRRFYREECDLPDKTTNLRELTHELTRSLPAAMDWTNPEIAQGQRSLPGCCANTTDTDLCAPTLAESPPLDLDAELTPYPIR